MTKQSRYNPSHPSKHAEDRVKDKLPIPTVCPNCGGPVACVLNGAIYGKTYGDYPWTYLCVTYDAEGKPPVRNEACDSYVGLHPSTAYPLGFLANEPTRRARKNAKEIFNTLWPRLMTRTNAYAMLTERMGMEPGSCHFGWFSVAKCEQATRVMLAYLEECVNEHERQMAATL